MDTVLAPVEIGATFAAGAADSLTFGATDLARGLLWGTENNKINYKYTYIAGECVETTAEIVLTGGSAVLKKAAAKKIAKESAEYAAKKAGKKISVAAQRNAAQAAKDRIKGRLRKEARKISNATKNDVTHHINTIAGHPAYSGGWLGPARGPVTSEFPMMGWNWVVNNPKNLLNIVKNNPGKHVILHQRAFLAEKLTIWGAHPALTGIRTLLNVNRSNSLDITIEQKKVE